jgi:hypothetical protein
MIDPQLIPPQRKFLLFGGGGKKVFLMIVSVQLVHLKGVGQGLSGMTISI